jgi:hypothetical protein
MTKFHTLAGVVYMVGWFVYLDGALTAQNLGDPYNFVESLPGIFCSFGLILLAICNVRSITSSSGDDDTWGMMGGGGGGGGLGDDDENAPIKARVLFFIAASFMLAGMTVAVWQLAGPRQNHPWTGWAMLLQVFIQMIAAVLLAAGQVVREQAHDDGFAS